MAKSKRTPVLKTARKSRVRRRPTKTRSKTSLPAIKNQQRQLPAVASPSSDGHPQIHFVVGMGASAGGLHAFEQFFRKMPADSGLVFVVVTHLDPKHTSLLPELLARFTTMPVKHIESGEEMEPDRVYVAPENRNVIIRDNHLILLEQDGELTAVRLPIDYFFRSLADSHGDQAIAILFSGNGSDGTLGVREIKGTGGLVIAQDPATAEYAGLPQSAIHTNLVDFILPPDKIPERLINYVNHARRYSPAELELRSYEGLKKIYKLIQASTGHDFSFYKKNTVHRRIERRLLVNQLDDVTEYAKYMAKHPEEAEILFKELLIGVTSFFRDRQAFDALRDKILPNWLTKRREQESIRVWVPGCSGGEEAYSLAILLHETLHDLKLPLKVQIFGTDIDVEAIETARSGIYPRNIENDVSPQRLRQYFSRKGDSYQVRKDIREMAIFAPHNVVKDPPFTRLDLISCRNLLIYMDGELHRKLLPIFHYSLRPEGILFLGTSESVGAFSDLFAPLDKKLKIYKRKAAQPHHVLFDLHSRSLAAPTGPVAKDKPASSNLRDIVERRLLESYAPPCVVVNAKGDLVYVHGRTGKFLEPAAGQANLNLIEMVREGLRVELSAAIRKAINRKKDVTYLGARLKSNGGHEQINVIIRHLRHPDLPKGILMVAFEVQPARNPKIEKTLKVRNRGDGARQLELERELHYTREHLQTTIEEMETSNEELKSTNEELQSTNEELQSTNEELETSKEELQSLNEELVTVNTELQSKLEELAAINNDMKNLLNSTEIATIFVDNKLNVKKFTSEANRIINLIPSDMGRPLRHIVSNLEYDRLIQDIEAVLATLTPRECEVRTRNGQWYVMRILPYRTLDNVIEGVVVTFSDITQQKRTEHELKEMTILAEGNKLVDRVFGMVNQALLVLDNDLRVVRVNDLFCDMLGVPATEIKHKLIYEIGDSSWNLLQLKYLLESVIPENETVPRYEFSTAGGRRLLLAARRLDKKDVGADMILLTIKDQQPQQ